MKFDTILAIKNQPHFNPVTMINNMEEEVAYGQSSSIIYRNLHLNLIISAKKTNGKKFKQIKVNTYCLLNV